MVLSTGTLNLKFMQRAAARNQSSAPSTPSTPASQPLASNAPSQSQPGSSSTPSSTPARPQTDGSSQADASNGQPSSSEMWFLQRKPQTSTSTSTSSQASSKGKGKAESWTFNSSYMSFITPAPDGQSASEVTAGGGRMTFGFSDDKATEQEDGTAQDGEEGSEDKFIGQDDDGDMTIQRATNPKQSQHQEKADRSFRRPKGFSPPSTPNPVPSQSKQSNQQQSYRLASSGPKAAAEAPTDTPNKKRKQPPSTSPSVSNKGGPVDLDAREKALKEAKRKEKKKLKKEKARKEAQ